MSKKKMCPYKDTWDCTATPHMCPKNTNDRCEIIPKKPKMVRIKGWASISEEWGGWQFVEQGHGVLSIPAELHINAKYLRRKP